MSGDIIVICDGSYQERKAKLLTVKNLIDEGSYSFFVMDYQTITSKCIKEDDVLDVAGIIVADKYESYDNLILYARACKCAIVFLPL